MHKLKKDGNAAEVGAHREFYLPLIFSAASCHVRCMGDRMFKII